MAVVSANRVGEVAPLDSAAAQEQLGESVSVYLDSGPCTPTDPSTVVDLTVTPPRLLREGSLAVSLLRTLVPKLELLDEPSAPAS